MLDCTFRVTWQIATHFLTNRHTNAYTDTYQGVCHRPIVVIIGAVLHFEDLCNMNHMYLSPVLLFLIGLLYDSLACSDATGARGGGGL